MKNLAVIQTIFEAAKVGKAQFVFVRNYRNEEGEISNYLINLGMKYSEQREKDIEKLKQISFKEENILLEEARLKLLESHTKNTTDTTRTNASQAQIDAYLVLCDNVKLCKSQYSLHMFGFLVTKTVIQAIQYKAVNSSALTLAKKNVQKKLDLSTSKFRNFKFEHMENTVVSINGEQIEITYE